MKEVSDLSVERLLAVGTAAYRNHPKDMYGNMRVSGSSQRGWHSLKNLSEYKNMFKRLQIYLERQPDDYLIWWRRSNWFWSTHIFDGLNMVKHVGCSWVLGECIFCFLLVRIFVFHDVWWNLTEHSWVSVVSLIWHIFVVFTPICVILLLYALCSLNSLRWKMIRSNKSLQ